MQQCHQWRHFLLRMHVNRYEVDEAGLDQIACSRFLCRTRLMGRRRAPLFCAVVSALRGRRGGSRDVPRPVPLP